ncbi:hypothetical protein [Tepidicella baoligensis]|uniref:hypothetical protein n=1 Tax=Tepidicella baoligensis TaxID=2707016 RepID=UPI0015DA9635|nr:hypothetical protein [Tepidicella baoligensis]
MTERRHRFIRALVGTLAAVMSAGLVACSSGLEGSYEDPMGVTRYTFQSNGKVLIRLMGTEVEMTYEKDGDKIKVGTPEGRVVMTLLDDGSIQGPMGVKLTRIPR